MSQAKVDKRKYEKKHRKELEKKRKINTAMKWIGAALVVGVIIGVPLGISIYNKIPKFVGDSVLEAYVSNYIDENYSEDLAGVPTNADLELLESATTEAEDGITDAIEDVVEEGVSDMEESATEESTEE